MSAQLSISTQESLKASGKCPNVVVQGDIDTTYHTQQRDMFVSGLAAEIGVNAFAVWHAIKSHADYQTGVAWPGIRRLMALTGLSTDPVQAAIKKLVAHHLLRISKRGRKNIYIARERMDVRVGNVVICTIAIDFVPATMRERLTKLKQSAAGDLESSDVWAEVELIPGPGMKFDASSGNFNMAMRADQTSSPPPLPYPPAKPLTRTEARDRLLEMANQMREKAQQAPPKF